MYRSLTIQRIRLIRGNIWYSRKPTVVGHSIYLFQPSKACRYVHRATWIVQSHTDLNQFPMGMEEDGRRFPFECLTLNFPGNLWNSFRGWAKEIRSCWESRIWGTIPLLITIPFPKISNNTCRESVSIFRKIQLIRNEIYIQNLNKGDFIKQKNNFQGVGWWLKICNITLYIVTGLKGSERSLFQGCKFEPHSIWFIRPNLFWGVLAFQARSCERTSLIQ